MGATSFPCLPGFHLNIYEVFSCVASCASSVLSLCVPSVPVSSPFCNPCRPSHFSVPIRSVAPVRLPCFPCVRLLSSSIHLSLPPCLLLFYGLCPSLLSFLCVRLLTHALYFPCVPFIPVLFPLFPVAFPSSSSFVPAFSVPCSPLFPLLRFPFRKKFSLKSCMISSVKYMFYSIFLACLWKFS